MFYSTVSLPCITIIMHNLLHAIFMKQSLIIHPKNGRCEKQNLTSIKKCSSEAMVVPYGPRQQVSHIHTISRSTRSHTFYNKHYTQTIPSSDHSPICQTLEGIIVFPTDQNEQFLTPSNPISWKAIKGWVNLSLSPIVSFSASTYAINLIALQTSMWVLHYYIH